MRLTALASGWLMAAAILIAASAGEAGTTVQGQAPTSFQNDAGITHDIVVNVLVGVDSVTHQSCLIVGGTYYDANCQIPGAGGGGGGSGGAITAVQLPSALGSTSAAGSLSVTFASDQLLPGFASTPTFNCGTGCGTAIPVTPAEASGTITTGGSFQQIFASNSSRANCSIQNPVTATEPLYVHWTATTASSANSQSLGPGDDHGPLLRRQWVLT
jgi:hypothetical protein